MRTKTFSLATTTLTAITIKGIQGYSSVPVGEIRHPWQIRGEEVGWKTIRVDRQPPFPTIQAPCYQTRCSAADCHRRRPPFRTGRRVWATTSATAATLTTPHVKHRLQTRASTCHDRNRQRQVSYSIVVASVLLLASQVPVIVWEEEPTLVHVSSVKWSRTATWINMAFRGSRLDYGDQLRPVSSVKSTILHPLYWHPWALSRIMLGGELFVLLPKR
mmetsp:Transcript_19662/g.32622  ORF Transcript_19662/g.32622 Transcript_19662/m.32622 type:complete len:217 (+) Transcript_19662:219-869(+)